MRALRLQAGEEYKSWESKGFRIVKECIQKLAESLAYDVVKQGTQKVTREDAERWLQQNPTFLYMLEEVFTHLYHYRANKNLQEEQVGVRPRRPSIKTNYLLPLCEGNLHLKLYAIITDKKYALCYQFLGLQYVPDYPAFTDISQMLFINSNLPHDHRNKWRFLFSSQIHGESFSTLLGRIMDQGATVLIIEDTNGYIFGGFAPGSWSLGPNFFGK